MRSRWVEISAGALVAIFLALVWTAEARKSETIDEPLFIGGPVQPSTVITVGRFNDIADAALAASVFHYGTYTIGELKEHLDRHGIPVRNA